MADQKVNIKISAQGAKKTQGELKGVSGSIKKMGKAVVGATTAFYSARGLINGISHVVKVSSELENVKKGFDNLARSSGFSANTLQKLKSATDNTMNSMELMTQANNMMLLGITDSEDQMAEMFDVAQRLASALGKDTAFGVESLTTGLGRQSKLMLDNLGIMLDANEANQKYADSINKSVDELTDQERKQAFVNEAMSQAKDLVSNLGEEQLSTADSIAQMKSSLFELAVTLGDQLSPFVIDLSGKLVTLTNQFSSLVKGIKGIETTEETILALSEHINKVNDVMELTKELTSDPSGAFPIKTLKEFNDSMKEIGFSQEDIANSQILLGNNSEEFNSHMKELIATLQSEIDLLLDKQPKVLKGIEAQSNATKSLTTDKEKQLMTDLKSAALSGQSAMSAMKSVVRAETMEAVSGYISSVLKGTPYPLNLILAAGGGGLVAGLMDNALSSVTAETGFEGVVTKPTMFLTGENNKPEQVSVTPLGGGSASGVTINISAPLVDDTVVESIIPAIERAKRMNLA
jgi:hypothetical protein